MKNVIWTSQEGRKEPQRLLELSEKQDFPSPSPSQWGLPLRWQEGTAEPVTAGPAPARLSGCGERGSAQGPATTAPKGQARSDIGNTCSLERGGEKKQQKIHTIAVGRRVRETRARLEGLRRGTRQRGSTHTLPALPGTQHAQPPQHQTCFLRVKQPEG